MRLTIGTAASRMASFNARSSLGWRVLSAGGPPLSRYSICMPPSVITPSGQSLAAASPPGRCHSLLGTEPALVTQGLELTDIISIWGL
jgi:hypothetical protein